MGLQILIAGCPRDERPRVESTVRRAVGQRADQGAWTISLVRLGSEWQVTIDGPEPLRGVSLTVPEIRLQNAIVEAIAKSPAASAAPPAPARPAPSSVPGRTFSVATGSPGAASSPAVPRPSPPSAPAAGEARDKHECSKCGQGFVVVYAKLPGEGTTKAPVACPKCWQVMQVPIALQAAQHEDYRAEAV
ncbi:MAG TPA: hypothetical protein VGC53_15415 [Vicinamibacteria bacterium]